MPDNAKISERNAIECIVSARLWATRIGPYSAKMQAIADRYTISASLISTITGLAAWGIIAKSPGLWAQILVGLMAFAAAAVVVIPKVIGYSDCAVKAAPLSAEYGKVLGNLLNAQEDFLERDPKAQDNLKAAIDEFEQVRAKKQALRPFPAKLQTLVDVKRPEAIKEEEAAVAARKAELAVA